MTSSFIDALEVSTRTYRALMKLDVRNLDQFMAINRPIIMRMVGWGKKTWQEIEGVQDYFKDTYQGGQDFQAIAAKLGAINSLRMKHPYFTIVLEADGSLAVVDTRGIIMGPRP